MWNFFNSWCDETVTKVLTWQIVPIIANKSLTKLPKLPLLKPYPKIYTFSALLLCFRRICILVAAVAALAFDNVSPLTPVLPNLYVTVIGWEHTSKEIILKGRVTLFPSSPSECLKTKIWFESFTFPGVCNVFIPRKGLCCPFTRKISQQCSCLCGVGEAVWQQIVLQSYFIKTH